MDNVISNDRVRIKSDIPILTENRIENNKPDLMFHDLKSNEITIIEVGITNKRILPAVETTKGRKYENLAGDLKAGSVKDDIVKLSLVIKIEFSTPQIIIITIVY